jgi:hypothetical protein
VAAGLVAGSGHAQTIDAARLAECARVPDDGPRLACFDALTAALVPELGAERARQRAEASAVAETDRKAAFGRETMRTAQRPPEAGTAGDAPRDLSARVEEVLTGRDGQAVFVLDNGQMWRQTDGMPLPPVRAGADVTIRRMMAGRFALTIDRPRRTVTVVRMR